MDTLDLLLAAQPYFDKLAAMGSAEEIRQFLATEGIRGDAESATRCAIAEYVRRGVDVEVAVCNISVYGPFGHVGTPTQAMKEFINNFDAGRYPELVAE